MKKNKPVNKEHHDFISRNYKTMPDKQMAKELGISKKNVRDHINRIKASPGAGEKDPGIKKPPLTTGKPVFSKIMTLLLFISILVFAFTLRKHTFNLPHYRGDQHHYIALAMKLDEQGIKGYNLRNVDMYGTKQYPELVTFAMAKDKGALLNHLAAGGITYYDEPLHHMPFGFPAALMISHKLFDAGQPYQALAIPNDTAVIRQAPPGVGLKNYRFDPAVAGKQFYAVIVPLFFSFVLIISTYFLAKALYKNESIALTAMFLMTISPIDIVTSQKVWADDMTAGLTALAALLYVLSRKKELPLLALLGGILSGIGIITKQMAAILPVAIVIWHFISNSDRLFKKETCLKVIFDRNLILFCLGAVLASAYWFIKITSVYGSPLYRPHQADLIDKAQTGWFKMMQSRPRHLYLLGIPYQNPLFVLAYISPLFLFFDRKNRKNKLFAVIWLVVTFIFSYKFFTGEHRYMLPFYAAFAMSGAYVANKTRVFIDNQLGFYAGTLLLCIALILSAFWSVPMGLETVFYNGAVIMKPF